MTLKVGLVAGETSGDTLGAALIAAIRARVPDAQFFGMAGPKMVALGCEAWASSDDLGVMGLVEVLTHLPRLLGLRRRLVRRFLEARPDVVVGIDVPDFNLGLEKKLKRAGLRTVQYVSPQVWAWRQSRVHGIRKSVDLVLCLLPFEKRFYDEQGVAAEFVGHPLADAIPLEVDRSRARAELDLPADAQIVALLPGSRRGEVWRLAGDFARTAQWLAAQRPDLLFVAPMANPLVADVFAAALERVAPRVKVRLFDGHAQTVLIAADVVLVASGTASLEAALCKRPMVVVYRLGAMTVWVLKRLNLVKSKFFAQPNLLADRRVVGEYFQAEIVPESIGAELLMWLDEAPRREALEQEFLRVHVSLKRDASARAAQAVFALANRQPAARGPA